MLKGVAPAKIIYLFIYINIYIQIDKDIFVMFLFVQLNLSGVQSNISYYF